MPRYDLHIMATFLTRYFASTSIYLLERMTTMLLTVWLHDACGVTNCGVTDASGIKQAAGSRQRAAEQLFSILHHNHNVLVSFSASSVPAKTTF